MTGRELRAVLRARNRTYIEFADFIDRTERQVQRWCSENTEIPRFAEAFLERFPAKEVRLVIRYRPVHPGDPVPDTQVLQGDDALKVLRAERMRRHHERKQGGEEAEDATASATRLVAPVGAA
jgi:hypothetical protein